MRKVVVNKNTYQESKWCGVNLLSNIYELISLVAYYAGSKKTVIKISEMIGWYRVKRRSYKKGRWVFFSGKE